MCRPPLEHYCVVPVDLQEPKVLPPPPRPRPFPQLYLALFSDLASGCFVVSLPLSTGSPEEIERLRTPDIEQDQGVFSPKTRPLSATRWRLLYRHVTSDVCPPVASDQRL